jgi:hypothetical protein
MDDCDRFVGAGDAPKIRAVQRFSTLSKALKLDSIYGGRGKARLEDRTRGHSVWSETGLIGSQRIA